MLIIASSRDARIIEAVVRGITMQHFNSQFPFRRRGCGGPADQLRACGSI